MGKKCNKEKRNQTYNIFLPYYFIKNEQRQNSGGENCLNLSSCYICLCVDRLGNML